MLIIICAIILAVLGSIALRLSYYAVDHSSAYSVGGYIAFIISFALLEYGLISMSIVFVFGVWAAGNAVLTTVIGRMFYEERLSGTKILSLIVIMIGLLGLSLS